MAACARPAGALRALLVASLQIISRVSAAGCAPAEQITLHPAALQDPEQGGLIGGFRALADRVQSQCASHSEGQADRFKQSLGHVFRPGDIRAWHAAALTNFYSIFGDVLSIAETLEAFDRRRGV